MRAATLICAVYVAIAGTAHDAGAGEAWTLDSHAKGNGKNCSLSRTDRGRMFSVTLSLLPADDQGVIGLAFAEPKLMKGAKKALATLTFDNGTSESHRIEATPAGPLLVPIVTLNLPDVLQTFSESRKLTVATRYGSTSFSLDGLASRVAALRDCAGS
jgi:hypothetical protein